MFNKDKKKKEQPSKAEMEASLTELIAAEEELRLLKKEHGIEETEEEKKGFVHSVASFFERQADRPKVPVNKKKYLWLAGLTGWFGGHRFYSKHYKVGFLYLAFFWMGLGLYNTIIDVLQVIPMQADENGNVEL